MVGEFKELKVWQRSHILAIDLYRLTLSADLQEAV